MGWGRHREWVRRGTKLVCVSSPGKCWRGLIVTLSALIVTLAVGRMATIALSSLADERCECTCSGCTCRVSGGAEATCHDQEGNCHTVIALT